MIEKVGKERRGNAVPDTVVRLAILQSEVDRASDAPLSRLHIGSESSIVDTVARPFSKDGEM